MDQRLTTSHNTLSAILNIKINDEVFIESEKNKILVAAVESFIEKHKETVSDESTTVSLTSEENIMTREDEDCTEFSEEDDSEDEWDKYVYENITQKKCDNDTDDEIENADDLETVDRWNSGYDGNFSLHNNDIVMMNKSWDLFDSDKDKRFNPLD